MNKSSIANIKNTTIRAIMPLIIIVMTLVGCAGKDQSRASGNIYYSNVIDIDNHRLSPEESVVMEWYVENLKDSVSKYASPEHLHTLHKYHTGKPVSMWLIAAWEPRHTNYTGIVAEIKTIAPDKSFWNDTVFLEFMPGKSRTMNQMNNNHNSIVEFRNNAILSKEGKWSFSIRQINNTYLSNHYIKTIPADTSGLESNIDQQSLINFKSSHNSGNLEGITAIGIEIRSY